jgi:hypothetical protein
MVKALAMSVLVVAAPAQASYQDKLKPAESVSASALSAAAAIRCVKSLPAFRSVAINETINEDGTTDLAVIDAVGRAALWSVRPSATGVVVEGRGRLGGAKQIITPLRACLNA